MSEQEEATLPTAEEIAEHEKKLYSFYESQTKLLQKKKIYLTVLYDTEELETKRIQLQVKQAEMKHVFKTMFPKDEKKETPIPKTETNEN